MTFKTEKGQLAYQFLTGITICLWVWFFLLTVAVAFLPSMDTSGDILGFSPPAMAFLMACFFAPALVALLAIIRLIRRVVRLKRGGPEHRTRSVVLLCLESVALFCSLWAFLLPRVYPQREAIPRHCLLRGGTHRGGRGGGLEYCRLPLQLRRRNLQKAGQF